MGSAAIPAIVLATGEKGAYRFLEFFAADIRNRNTRMAYYRAACTFFEWCRRQRVANLADIGTHQVAAYIEQLGKVRSKPTV
ncbi:MAG: integrase, partial [Caldithrix sp.]